MEISKEKKKILEEAKRLDYILIKAIIEVEKICLDKVHDIYLKIDEENTIRFEMHHSNKVLRKCFHGRGEDLIDCSVPTKIKCLIEIEKTMKHNADTLRNNHKRVEKIIAKAVLDFNA